MIERVMNLPIFMFTRVALSVLISASAGIIVLSFLWMFWGFADDVYNALVLEEEVIVKETSVDLSPHIQPILVTAKKRTIE
ncbi:MAG: hypothetical protein HOH08_04790 [Gammaproteobacteria bacterium]|jgi:hypothetical protein|nr:hypothetical protein [Gammaproteobacteria bacterium]MBT5541329.1 hypothetical protein [Gammaproteobacteria bacterium]MBT6074251.1 hypothetical protein [Gammaproteobacteria bacterium]